jgi:hypothetical protein
MADGSSGTARGNMDSISTASLTRSSPTPFIEGRFKVGVARGKNRRILSSSNRQNRGVLPIYYTSHSNPASVPID